MTLRCNSSKHVLKLKYFHSWYTFERDWMHVVSDFIIIEHKSISIHITWNDQLYEEIIEYKAAIQSLVQALVHCRLDYCNSVPIGIANVRPNKLQSVQNRAGSIASGATTSLSFIIYTVNKKPTIFFVHNFAKCWPIFKIFPPLGSTRNLQ